MIKWMTGGFGVAMFVAVASFGASAQQNQMSFFITSVGSGSGANLGAWMERTALPEPRNGGWRRQSYLARLPERCGRAGQPAVHARDRWQGAWTMRRAWSAPRTSRNALRHERPQ